MHLAAGATGRIDDGAAAADLGQSPGDIVVLSAADSELALLAAAARAAPATRFRLCNLMRLAHPLSVDFYLERTASAAKLVVVRMMGGAGYWPYGLDRLRALARGGGPRLIVIPGDDRWDTGLEAFNTEPIETARRIWAYFGDACAANAAGAVAFMTHLIGRGPPPPAPRTLPRCGAYRPGEGAVPAERLLADLAGERAVAAIVFYRSILEGGATAPIDALASALADRGLAPLPLYVASLKDADSQDFLRLVFHRAPPAIVLNTTAFAVSAIGAAAGGTVLDQAGRPVLQVILAGSSEEAWRDSRRGLLPRDLTMNVVLPEVDGRIGTRAISFKAESHDPLTDSRIATYRPVADRVDFVAAQAAAWVKLGARPADQRRIAIVLSNYPNRASRIGNAVGLDTAASAVQIATAMAAAGYRVEGFPESAEELTGRLGYGRNERLAAGVYAAFLKRLPLSAREALAGRWGSPDDDPTFAGGAFPIHALAFGNLAIAVQPSRGDDGKEGLHDAELVPSHGYVAFYAWLRDVFGADAIIHLGKHGSLEWLPGKAMALSADCWPELMLGPLPLIYPFIVNDPGEGAQAKRRSSAVIIDHLTPPMMRAETHGPLAAIETMIDEYYLAAGVDPGRAAHLEREILTAAAAAGLDRDLGLSRGNSGEALRALDGWLCELKEMQIRDGLHILGSSPEAGSRTAMLVAIARAPRSGGRPENASLHRAIAGDLGLAGFDPLDCDPAEAWTGPRPAALASVSDSPWRTAGDTVERIELLAEQLVANATVVAESDAAAWRGGSATRVVLDWIVRDLAAALDASRPAEIEAVLAALDGRFIRPGPSGAPTRARPEVLPTGRNFYSVDIRAVPTAAAWALGRAAAEAMALRYFQDEGEWPRSVAISAWGTANMRTGGDDIAQAMAFVGAEPVWERGTGRVTGYRVMSLAELGRPRIDVTLRVSGLFRDAFPDQMDLLASAFGAIAALDEDDAANPLATAARRGESIRIFGAKPGRYGAGIEATIDRGAWQNRAELAEAFVRWSGFAYGSSVTETEAADALRSRLRQVDAVLHNQDNREHDILDSADYPEFQGGLAAAVETLRGTAPRLYHGDHSRPERPLVRPLSDELSRVVRGRAANPKWIAGMMRHGYRGAMEMAAAVDLLFAWAALTHATGDHHFDQLYAAYIADETVRGFIADANPEALADMTARFREAIDRGLWMPRWNSAHDRLAVLAGAKEEAAE